MKAQKDSSPPGSDKIDELFSSALGRIEKQPSPSVWKTISAKLPASPIAPGELVGGINKWFYLGLAGVIITSAILFFQFRISETQKSAGISFLAASPDSVISTDKNNITHTEVEQNLISLSTLSHSSNVDADLPNISSNFTDTQHEHFDENLHNQTETESNDLFQIPVSSGIIADSSTISNTLESRTSETQNASESASTLLNESSTTIPERISDKSETNVLPGLSDSPVPKTILQDDSTKIKPTPPPRKMPTAAVTTPLSFNLELYIEPTLTGQLLKARSSDGDALLEYRKRNENPSSVLNWGLEGRVFRKNLFVQTGIRYSVFGANADYPFSATLLDSSRSHFEVNIQNKWEYHTYWVWTENSGVVYYVPAQDSNLVQLIDSTWKLLIDTSYNKRSEKSQLRYRYVEIPLLLGYQVGKGKLKTEFSGGVAVGFLSGMKGNIVSADLNSTIPANTDNFPYNKPLLNLLLRIGCSYNLNENWSIFGRSAFRYTPQSAFGTEYPLYQRNYSVGLQFGIKYSF
jgi:hypothetical protein